MEFPIFVGSKDGWSYNIFENFHEVDSAGYEKIDIENEEYWAWNSRDKPLQLYWDNELNTVRFREMKSHLNQPNISEYMCQHAERVKIEIKEERDPAEIANLIDAHYREKQKSLWFRIQKFFERF